MKSSVQYIVGVWIGAILIGMGGPLVVRGEGSCWDCYRLYLRGLVDQEEGRPLHAAAVYQEVLRKDSRAGLVNEDLTDAAMASGQSDVALQAALRYVEVSTANAGAYLLLGRVHLGRGEGAAARAAFEKALALDPGNIEALNLAASQRQIQDPLGARGLYEKFLRTHPENDDVRTTLAEVQRRQGDVKSAIESYEKIVRSDPSHSEALLALAGLYDVSQSTPAAIAAYEKYLDIFPDHFDVLSRVGQLKLLEGDIDGAQSYLDRALVIDPHNGAALFWRALVAQQRGDWNEAVDFMERAAKKSTETGVHLRLASYYAQVGREKDALGVLRRLHRQEPNNPDFMYFLALAYEDLNKPRSAIRWLDRLLAIDPNRVDALFHLAVNWDKRKRFDRAETALLKVIELDPNNHMAMNYLGYTWADNNRNLSRATELLERANALDPNNPAYRDSLGWVYYRAGRYSEAESILGSVARKANDPVVWSHYGDTLDAVGKKNEAVRAWQEGVLVDPNNKDLLKRLGVAGRPTRVLPQTAPRTLLKQIEGTFLQVVSLSGAASVTVTAERRSLTGQSLFYYTRPGLFRIEWWSPFFAPRAVMVFDGKAHWSPPGVPTPGGEEDWLPLWGSVMSGDFVRRFDDPSVKVSQEGTVVWYRSTDGELAVDARSRCLTWARITTPKGQSVQLKFSEPREQEGLVLPTVVEGTSSEEGAGFVLRFSRMTLNPSLNPALFVP
ncbi:MAG: tetratricopeptide repeat protein [Elusimicrobia bacterium]|nr:tetratricopeptide repeat protein [Elusimicrobiota bacterium]